MNDLNGGAECTLRFADYTKLGEVADKPLGFLPSKGTLTGWRTGQQEPREVQQEEVPSAAPGEGQPQVLTYSGDQTAGKQSGRKRPGDAGRHQAEHEPAVGPLSKET